ncbi:MAG: TerB family tellurite resistance protein [Alphaproteobacteria bacterium]|nr:TerB family tellurite resistance protein [Alphaproteobacteria bacterium]
MSIWGKLAGAVAGFAVGGPLGALFGTVAGHLVDRHRDARELRPGERDVAFTIGVIALSAKMAKADGTVSDEEIEAFRQIFAVPPHEVENVRRIYDLARQDVAGYEAYARQIARLFETGAPILEDLLDGLFHIAKADGSVHEKELIFLREVSRIFGFAGLAFERIAARHLGDARLDAYAVLGLEPGASAEEAKAAYRALVKANHPDALAARGVPEEFLKLANDRLVAINAAYERIERERSKAD